MDYNQLYAIKKRICMFFFLLEVHFQLSDDVYKKVPDKNLLQKLLIQKNYPLGVIAD